MGPIEQLQHILPAVNDLVDGIRPDQLQAPTPCDEFTVHDVLDHMIVLGTAFGHMFRGEPVPEQSAPAAYGRVPAREFRTAMEALLAAVESPGAMERQLDTPIGTMDGSTFARAVALDGLIHGWDLAVATRQTYAPDPIVTAAVHDFASAAIDDDLRATGMFSAATTAPTDATPVERVAALTGRKVVDRWRADRPQHIDKESLAHKIDIPGAVARQITGFGDATGYGSIAGEYFSLAAGTDIAPLLRGLDGDACHAPHWGYMLAGTVVVTFVDGAAATCREGEIFYWPPGHSVRVEADAEIVLFSPEHEHVEVLDHMLDQMANA